MAKWPGPGPRVFQNPGFNLYSICPHNMVKCRSLTADICWRVWGTSANFNGFRVLASLLHRRRSTEVNQTSYDVWPSLGLVQYYVHSCGLLPPNGILPAAEFTLRPSLAFSYIVSVTARRCSSGRQPNFAAWYKEGITELSQRAPPIFGCMRPSRWAS